MELLIVNMVKMSIIAMVLLHASNLFFISAKLRFLPSKRNNYQIITNIDLYPDGWECPSDGTWIPIEWSCVNHNDIKVWDCPV